MGGNYSAPDLVGLKYCPASNFPSKWLSEETIRHPAGGKRGRGKPGAVARAIRGQYAPRQLAPVEQSFKDIA
jgi:hypothetical protein